MIGVPLLSLLLALGGAPGASPYAGEQHRGIKALSPEAVARLLAGDGMGFAKAAELNGYPGPAHVLELADDLGLDEAQRVATRGIERRMRNAAIAAGRRLVEAERELDRAFAERTVTVESLAAALEEIAALEAELRRIHLDAHLRQTEVLTPEQIRHYAVLRGYEGGDHDEPPHHQR